MRYMAQPGRLRRAWQAPRLKEDQNSPRCSNHPKLFTSMRVDEAGPSRNLINCGCQPTKNSAHAHTEWKTCALQWQVVTTINLGTASTPQTSLYCGGSRSESKVATEDIAGKTLREVVTQIRAYPLADSVGADTDPISGLPMNWGPAPGLLPADALFPAGAKMSSRSIRTDVGGVDRIELTNKSAVR